jgi:hypothetical protein
MKLVTFALVFFATLAINTANAENATPQPLTRLFCDRAGLSWNASAGTCASNAAAIAGQPLRRSSCIEDGMQWDDRANVCQATSTRQPPVIPEVSSNLIQPLTRKECDMVGVAWNDGANVCGGSVAQAARNPAASTLLINIDKVRQRMTVSVDGVKRYRWPVSTGKPGYSTPSGTYTARSMNEIWYSRQWDNALMPHAVFFTKEGHDIHGTNEVKRLGKPASHGCVRISPQNAATLYDWLSKMAWKTLMLSSLG